MLHKFFGLRLVRDRLPERGRDLTPSEERRSLALKIIHAGGSVECYYMAVPAARIMEKYPSFVLARPEIFRRPWDTLVRPEEILIPGQKYYIVPRRTVKKLQRRIRTPAVDNSINTFVSHTYTDKKDDSTSKSLHQKGDVSISSICTSQTKRKIVRFSGVDYKSDSNSFYVKTKGNLEGKSKNGSYLETDGGKRRVRNAVTWQPALTVIKESHGAVE